MTTAAETLGDRVAALAGKRCVDVDTWDGFWAFEMEKRGAAEVVAIVRFVGVSHAAVRARPAR